MPRASAIGVLLKDVLAPALNEAFSNVPPEKHLARLLVDRGEPQGLAVRVKGSRLHSEQIMQ